MRDRRRGKHRSPDDLKARFGSMRFEDMMAIGPESPGSRLERTIGAAARRMLMPVLAMALMWLGWTWRALWWS